MLLVEGILQVIVVTAANFKQSVIARLADKRGSLCELLGKNFARNLLLRQLLNVSRLGLLAQRGRHVDHSRSRGSLHSSGGHGYRLRRRLGRHG